MEQKHKVMVEIFGENYPLKGSAEPERIMRVAAHLDGRMRQTAGAYPRLTTAKVAILTALNITDEYLRLQKDYQELLKLVRDGK
jgi:cell division protein ZapA